MRPVKKVKTIIINDWTNVKQNQEDHLKSNNIKIKNDENPEENDDLWNEADDDSILRYNNQRTSFEQWETEEFEDPNENQEEESIEEDEDEEISEEDNEEDYEDLKKVNKIDDYYSSNSLVKPIEEKKACEQLGNLLLKYSIFKKLSLKPNQISFCLSSDSGIIKLGYHKSSKLFQNDLNCQVACRWEIGNWHFEQETEELIPFVHDSELCEPIQKNDLNLSIVRTLIKQFLRRINLFKKEEQNGDNYKIYDY